MNIRNICSISLLIILAACVEWNPGDKLHWDVQYAHFDNSEVEEKGLIDYLSFAKELDSFPWTEQLQEANRLEKTSPSVSVESPTGKFLGTTIVGSADDFAFVMIYGESLRPEKTRVVQLDDLQAVDRVFEKFFNADVAVLDTYFENLGISAIEYAEMQGL